MGLFEDHLSMLRNPGNVEPPETILDDLASAHQEEISNAAAAVQQRDRLLKAEQEKAAALQLKLNEAKAKNFDSLMNAPAGDGGANGPDYSVQGQKKPRTFDDLFKKKVTP